MNIIINKNAFTFLLGDIFGGHVRAVFSLITIIFIGCVICTITAFKELPLDILESDTHNKQKKVNKKCKYSM